MVISHVAIEQGGKRTVLLDQEVTISTNRIAGESTNKAGALLSIPANGTSDGTIRTYGNASVSKGDSFRALRLFGDKKKLKAESASGLYAVARIGTQRSTGASYFDVIFGTAGQSELPDASGLKSRPHIAIAPDGNGQFLRLHGHSCEIESLLTYTSEECKISPNLFVIRSFDHQERLELVFGSENDGTQVLNEIRFIAQT
jgi:hypothetical protein